MPSYQEVHPERWLRPVMIKGKRLRVTIEAVTIEPLRNTRLNRSEPEVVAKLVGKEARLVLNKTQCRAMHKITGSSETEDWVGVSIILSVVLAPNDQDTILISPVSEAAAAT